MALLVLTCSQRNGFLPIFRATFPNPYDIVLMIAYRLHVFEINSKKFAHININTHQFVQNFFDSRLLIHFLYTSCIPLVNLLAIQVHDVVGLFILLEELFLSAVVDEAFLFVQSRFHLDTFFAAFVDGKIALGVVKLTFVSFRDLLRCFFFLLLAAAERVIEREK